MSIGNNIRKMRKKAGLTQKELGERLGDVYKRQFQTSLHAPSSSPCQVSADLLPPALRKDSVSTE